MNFEEVAVSWFEAQRIQLKESSIVKYYNILNTYLFPTFKNKSIELISIKEVSDYSRMLLLCGGQKEKGLSPKTVTSILSVMKNVFEYAVFSEGLQVQDIKKISVKQQQRPMRILSLNEQKMLSSYICEHPNLSNLGILICLYTGIRIGELCALKWEDILFEEQCLYVHRTMQRLQSTENGMKKTYILIAPPKSECSIRRIPIPDELFEMLVAAQCPDNTYFLTGSSEAFIEPRTMQNRFKAVIKECNIANANFHCLRHTFATRCVELGFDIKSLSEILGHSSVNITLNRYVHPSMELKQKNMDKLSELLIMSKSS